MKKYLNFVLLKPDLSERWLTEEFEKFLLEKNIFILYKWEKKITNKDFKCIYWNLSWKDFFQDLKLSFLWKKCNFFIVSSHYNNDFFDKNIIWDMNPKKAIKDSARQKFWINLIKNSVHSSKKHSTIKEILNFISFEEFLKLDIFNQYFSENTFILHWWWTSNKSNWNINFYKEIKNNYVNWEDWILYLPFASYYTDWNTKKIEKNLKNFLWEDLNVKLWSINNLEKQILDSKIIYINWWDYKKLFKYIWFLKDKKYLLFWKTIIWVSAWCNILSKYSYSWDYHQIFEGIGLLPYHTACHYRNTNALINTLHNDPSYPLLLLQEGEHIVVQP